jgi:DNA transformation protein
MPKANEYLEYVLEQLSGLPGVTSRRMFSGAGFYQDEVFFGLLFSGTLYFKVGDSNRADYESRGMQRFRPYKDRPDKPQVSFTYYEVPAEVLENREELTEWARRSVQAAVAIAAQKRARQRRPKAKRRGTKAKGKGKNVKQAAGGGGAGQTRREPARAQPRQMRVKREAGKIEGPSTSRAVTKPDATGRDRKPSKAKVQRHPTKATGRPR